MSINKEDSSIKCHQFVLRYARTVMAETIVLIKMFYHCVTKSKIWGEELDKNRTNWICTVQELQYISTYSSQVATPNLELVYDYLLHRIKPKNLNERKGIQ